MEKQTKEIRHDIYKWLDEQGFKLNDSQLSWLSSMIKEHGRVRDENIQRQLKIYQEHMDQCKLIRREKHAAQSKSGAKKTRIS